MSRISCFALFLATSSLYAQNAVVSGRVVDPSDAAVPNASITLTNKGTSIKAATSSNGEGYYVFPPQAPGTYEISVTAAGFAVTRLDGITLEVGQSRVINLALKPGEVKESITVQDVTPLLNEERADRGTVVETKFVEGHPIKLR